MELLAAQRAVRFGASENRSTIESTLMPPWIGLNSRGIAPREARVERTELAGHSSGGGSLLIC